jgi:FAD/FMN-containing dehydrogenase
MNPTTQSPTLIRELADQVDGEVVGPDDAQYDTVRKVWNGAIDRHPAAMVRCGSAADVVAAIRFGRRHSLPLTVRGGGHAVAGHAVHDDAIMIDLSVMNAVAVDASARTATVQGGALNSDLDRETQAHGLATTGGVVSHTGLGGLALGGGIGHLMRKWGLTVDNLLGAEVVTAAGEIVHASADEHADLFWALRGGGGNFGVVTAFELALHPLGPEVYAGMAVWPMTEARAVLAAMRDFIADAPDEVGMLANLRLAPPLPIVPAEFHGLPIVALVATYAGDPSDGPDAYRPLWDRLPEPALSTLGVTSYTQHQMMFDAAVPHGRHYYWRSHRLGPLGDAAIGTMVEHASAITSLFSSIPVFSFGGAVARVAPEDTAFAHRDAAHDINILASWAPDDPDAGRHVDWVRSFHAALEPESVGVYVNFTSDDVATSGRRAYSDEQWERLVQVKGTYDPQNLFNANANVPPPA